jgi:hypothetical protein
MSSAPPFRTDIIFREDEKGVSFEIPPVGLWRAGGVGAYGCGMFMGFTIFMAAFSALLTVAAVAGALFDFGESVSLPTGGWNAVLGLFLCWAIAGGFFLIAWHIGNRRTTVIVRDGSFWIDLTGPLGHRRIEFNRADLYDIKHANADTSDGPSLNVPVLVIITIKRGPRRNWGIHRPPYREFELLAGWPREEIDWVAGKLKAALNLPTPKPMSFWEWLRRDYPQ